MTFIHTPKAEYVLVYDNDTKEHGIFTGESIAQIAEEACHVAIAIEAYPWELKPLSDRSEVVAWSSAESPNKFLVAPQAS